MSRLAIAALVLAVLIAFVGWAACKVGGDADDRAGYDEDEHEGGLPL